MAEGTYEYECMRAELLGIEKPDYEQFKKNVEENEKKQVQEEEVDVENLKEIDLEEEGYTRVSGKLDELSSILKKTQSKINRMKASCGSVAGLLKNRLGSFTSQSSLDADQVDNADQPVPEKEAIDSDNDSPEKTKTAENGTSERKSDLQKALDKDLSALDKMIERAEQAQYSMSDQTKEMKRFM